VTIPPLGPNESVYLSVLSDSVQSMCAPFWWNVKRPEDTTAQILHNGTICYVNTGSREIGITANHVYQTYLDDLERYGVQAIECQFGSSTIYPERRAIAQSKRLDIASFDIPAVFVSAATGLSKTHHHAIQWPPRRVEKSELVVYGGYPGVLRKEKGSIAELPFQVIAGRVNDVSEQNIVLEPEFQTSRWLNEEKNDDPGGWSGGPVFRYAHEPPIERLELVGFIYAFPLGQAVLARHADAVLADGSLHEGAAHPLV
jgi:hypothetical protein